MILLEISFNSIFLPIVGSLMTGMLIMISYFLIQKDKRQQEINKELSHNIERLTASISGLNATLLLLDEKHLNLEKRFDKHEKNTEKKFEKLKV